MQVELVRQFASENLYVIATLSQMYYPIEKCNGAKRREQYRQYSIDLIFSTSRYIRPVYSRYLLIYAMRMNKFTFVKISEILNQSKSNCLLGFNLVKNHLKLYATCDETHLINELVLDFKKLLLLCKTTN